MPQEQSTRIDALWNKLQKNTSLVPNEGNKNLSSIEKENIMRKNITSYEKSNLNNSINSLPGMEMKVDKNFATLSPKEVKVIEFAAKALDALDKVKDYSAKNPRPYDKVDSYLKRIDNIDKPGLVKKAVIAANDKIVQPLASKSANKVQELKNERNTNPKKTDIEKAKNIGINLASLIDKRMVQKIATSAQAKVDNYKNKKEERTR